MRHEAIRGKMLHEVEAMTAVEVQPNLEATVDRQVLALGEPHRREAHVARDGNDHVLANVRFPVLDSGSRIVAVAGIDLDIAAQKRNEAEMAEL